MINLQNTASFLSTINEWNEKLNAFTGDMLIMQFLLLLQ